MAATGKIFGVKIILNDHISPVASSNAIGLYSITSDLSGNAASSQKDVAVDDGTIFAANEVVTVTDDNASETAIIASIAGDTLTMQENLTNSYTTAANALVNGNSVFRWVQNAVGGLSTWLGGFIVDKGIKAWTKTIDLKRGGNIAQAGACQVVVKNTSLFWNTLKSKSIYFNGLRCEIYEVQHIYSGGGSNQVTLIRRWAGICQKPKWNTKQYSIPLVGFHRKRIANIGAQINIKDYPDASGDLLGKAIPVSFGKIHPRFDASDNIIYNGYFKFVRTADKETVFKLSNQLVVNTSENIELILDNEKEDTGRSIFASTGTDGGDPPLRYNIKIATENIHWRKGGVPVSSGTLLASDLVGYFIKGVKGSGSGEYRKIQTAIIDLDDDDKEIQLTAADYYEASLHSASDAKASGQSWVQLIDIDRQYKSDVFPCKDFLDEDGNVVTSGYDVFSYNSDKSVKVSGDAETVSVDEKIISFFRLPQYAYTDLNDGNKTTLNIDLKLFDDDPDKMNSFLISPIVSAKLSNLPNLSVWNIDGDGTFWNAYTKTVFNGLYDVQGFRIDTLNSFAKNGEFSNMFDKDQTTFYQMLLNYTDTSNEHIIKTAFALIFKMPNLPGRFTFDNVYLLLNTASQHNDVGTFISSQMHVRYRRYIGYAKQILTKDDGELYNDEEPATATMKSDPDFYYTAGSLPLTNNLNFYNPNALSSDEVEYRGYIRYPFEEIDSPETYQSIKECCIFLQHEIQWRTGDSNFIKNLVVNELAIVFKKSVSIKDALYSPFSGRIFNDTWGGRFTPTNLMTSPRNIMEHIYRLENWEDTSSPPSAGWGLGYAPGALIKTGATTIEGDFDYAGPEFTILDTYEASTQLQIYNKFYTDSIKTSICRDFWCAAYYDQNGFANFKRIIKSETSPSDTVTLADIVDRSKIIITEPKPADIFPEPFVRYRKNFATGEYESIIKVTHADAESYNSDFVEGLSDTTAEELWNRCNALFKKARHLEKPPADMTNKIWFNGSDADSLAQDYIFNWVDWMFNPMIQFPVHYNKAGSWNEAQRFTLQLPHQTNDAVIECLLTGLKVDPNPPYHVIVTAIMFSETIPEEFNFKDTFDSVSLQWKDQDSVLGDANDKKDNT